MLPSYTLHVPPAAITGTPVTITLAVEAFTGSDTVTLSDGGAGGTFSPSSLTINGQGNYTSVYTNSHPGSHAITATSSAGGSIWGSGSRVQVADALPPSYTVTIAYQDQGGGPLVLTYTPAALVDSDTLTPSDGGAGGSFDPPTLTFTNTSKPQSTVYTPAHPSIDLLFSSQANGTAPKIKLEVFPLV